MPKSARKRVVRALDTEVTGLDIYHTSRPYFVTFYDETNEHTCFEWSVDPLTRKVLASKEDLLEIQRLVDESDEIILQHSKYDHSALRELFADHGLVLRWDWGKTKDTLLSSHLIASNQLKDLTVQAIKFLDLDIKPYEDALEEATQKSRRLVRSKKLATTKCKGWKIASKDLPEMPSMKESLWKADMWLLKELVAVGEGPKEWLDLLPEYANTDSYTTYYVGLKHQEIIKQRGLEKLYAERLKVLPIASEMEQVGVVLNKKRLYTQRARYCKESEDSSEKMLSIADKHKFELEVPKGGRNKSLTEFMFQYLKLLPIKTSAKTGEPSMDSDTLEHYEAILPPGESLEFVKALRSKRSRDTAASYLDSYERFWLPTVDKGWYRLHPSINPTGTDTLRWSSKCPNSQNISKQDDFNLRGCFGPGPGREWYSMDGKNLELRVPAYRANERAMIDLFERPDEAPFYGSNHLLNFSIVYPDLWTSELELVGIEKVGPHCKKKYAATWYQWCKNGGFCKQYGGQRVKTDATFHRVGAYSLLESRFSGLAKLNTECIEIARRQGYIETLPDKTVDPTRGYPLLCVGGRYKYGVSPTIPLNYMVQGTACWWMMKAMIRCYEHLKENNKSKPVEQHSYIVMQIHDELVIDCPKSTGSKNTNLPLIATLNKLMAQGGDDIGIPTPVSCEYHPVTWAEGIAIVL